MSRLRVYPTTGPEGPYTLEIDGRPIRKDFATASAALLHFRVIHCRQRRLDPEPPKQLQPCK